MNKHKHISGPWITEDGDFIYHLNSNGHNSFEVSVKRGCICDDCKRLPEVDIEAHTNLLNSAPELFESLTEALDSLAFSEKELTHQGLIPDEDSRVLRERIKKAKAAIKKALGESK